MREFSTGAQGVRFFRYSARVSAFLSFAICFGSIARAQTTDTIPPTPPTGLVATASSCGQVDLSWGASADNVGGSGLKAYSIWRSDNGVNTVTSTGASRAWFDDTIYVKSSGTMSYYVVAVDNAGNQSLPSNAVTVNTPACVLAASDQIGDSAHL